MEIDSWLSDQIEAHAPERESDPAAAARLAEAYAALANAAQQAFGLAIPAEIPDRERLRTRALELLKQWIAKLDPEQKDKLRAQMAGYGLPVGAPLPSSFEPPPEGTQT